MAMDSDPTRFAAASARTFFVATTLTIVAGFLVSCSSLQQRDAGERLFVAVDRPPLTSDRASTGGVSSPDPGPQANRFYENLQGHFEARTVEGLTDFDGFSSGSTWADFDNDGNLDLVVANWGGASEIYLNDGSGHFGQVGPEALRRSIHYASSVALADYDGDGDLDILIGNWPNQPGEGFEEDTLIENRFADGNWIRVLLEGTASNRSAIGALTIAGPPINEVLSVREAR